MVWALLISTTALSVHLGGPLVQCGAQTVYQRVVTAPDPANGYEDYLRAADIVNDGLFDVYAGWMPSQYQAYEEQYRTTNADERAALSPKVELSKELSTLDYLRVLKAMVERYARAVDFVTLGNQKNVYEPRKKIDPQTVFPEYRHFRSLARLLVGSAYVDFADGKDQDGSDLLLEALQFSQKSGTDSIMIADLVSIAERSVTLRAFNTHLNRVPLSAWEKVVEYCDTALADTKQFARCLAGERRSFQNTFQSSDPTKLADSIRSDLGTQYPGASKAVQSMSTAELTHLASDLVLNANKAYDGMIATYDQPESKWLSSSPDSALEVKDGANPSYSDLLEILISAYLPTFSNAARGFEVSRTQLRLLRLHALIQMFRWRNNKLPGALSQVATADQVSDPMSGGRFVYTVVDLERYKLYGVGTADTGQIGLFYQRPDSLGGKQVEPPQNR